MGINVVSLANPVHAGDWHDKPLKWSVVGPDREVQNFRTKRDAERYRSIRKRSFSFTEAVKEYCKF